MAWAGRDRRGITSNNRASPGIPRLKPGLGSTLLRRALPSDSVGLRRIQSPEVLEHEPPLLGREPHELFPPGVAELRSRAGGARLQHRGNVHAVAGRGATHALLFFVGLFALEGAARVQQPAVQPLLALNRLFIEASRLELARQLARFLRERRGRGTRPLRLETLELLGEGTLAGGEGAQLREHRLPARTDQRQQALRLAVHALLIARQPRQLLHRLGEAAPRLRA